MNQTTNPYSPNQINVVPRKRFVFSHSKAMNYVFENPNWMQNILLTAVCIFIPVIGPIVLYGYHIEVVECLHREQGRRYPNFDFNRFTEYLSRGIWIFLVLLLVNLILVPVMWVVIVGGLALMGVIATMAGPDGAGWTFLITFPGLFVLIACVSIFSSMILVPVMLRTGLSQEFGEGFNFGFAMEFVGKTWKQIAISSVLMYFFSIVITLLGMLALCIGIYVAIAYLGLVYSHLGWQLYELHLSKGGSPIPLKQPTHYVHPVPPMK